MPQRERAVPRRGSALRHDGGAQREPDPWYMDHNPGYIQVALWPRSRGTVKSRMRAVRNGAIGLSLALLLCFSGPAWAGPGDGVIPDLRGSSAWSMLYGWEGVEMPDGDGHRVVVNRSQGNANYSISLAQARVAARIDSSYLVAMRDIYAPLDFVTEYETRLDDLVGSLCHALGLDPGQTEQVRRMLRGAVQAEGRRSYHVVVGKLIFHCQSYLPTRVTQGWTLTILSTSSHHSLARGIVAQMKAQNAKKDKIRLNQAIRFRAARSWRSLHALATEWTEDNPGNAQAWLFLGEAALELGRYAQATAALERGVKIGKGDGKAWKRLGYAQARMRQYKQAAASFEKALERNPRDAEALFNLGVCYAHLQRYTALPGVHLRLRAIDPELGARFEAALIRPLPIQQAELRLSGGRQTGSDQTDLP